MNGDATAVSQEAQAGLGATRKAATAREAEQKQDTGEPAGAASANSMKRLVALQEQQRAARQHSACLKRRSSRESSRRRRPSRDSERKSSRDIRRRPYTCRLFRVDEYVQELQHIPWHGYIVVRMPHF